MNKLFVFLLAFSFFSCSQETASIQKNYFDLDSFIKKIISDETSQKPTIKKAISLDKKEEIIETNNINWEKELELFLQADLNKASLSA